MTDLVLLASVRSKTVLIGGDQHAGWLPAQAAKPLNLPLREVELSFELQFDGSGYLLCYSSKDGSVHGDTWHVSQAEAEQVAKEDFGVEQLEWQRGSNPSFQQSASGAR